MNTLQKDDLHSNRELTNLAQHLITGCRLEGINLTCVCGISALCRNAVGAAPKKTRRLLTEELRPALHPSSAAILCVRARPHAPVLCLCSACTKAPQGGSRSVVTDIDWFVSNNVVHVGQPARKLFHAYILTLVVVIKLFQRVQDLFCWDARAKHACLALFARQSSILAGVPRLEDPVSLSLQRLQREVDGLVMRHMGGLVQQSIHLFVGSRREHHS
mmetsp:Transcript_4752/g.13190  ORF Transcript_4752/g.13190 Transcript_4752/m.13190 type:complete len:217 (+) Transcript_4752:203-853(+)